MAHIRVRMFATVREAAGIAETSIDAHDLGEVLEKLGAKFGKPLSDLLHDHLEDPETLVVLVNGRNLGARGARGAELNEGDEVSIFPPVSGG